MSALKEDANIHNCTFLRKSASTFGCLCTLTTKKKKKKQSSKHYKYIPTIYKCLRENIMVIPYMCVYYPHYTCAGAYEDLKI